MSNEIKAMEALQRAAKQTDPLSDPRLEAFSAGTLSREDEEDLLALAKRRGISLDVFRPRSDGEDEKAIEAMIATMNRTRSKPKPEVANGGATVGVRPSHLPNEEMVGGAIAIAAVSRPSQLSRFAPWMSLAAMFAVVAIVLDSRVSPNPPETFLLHITGAAVEQRSAPSVAASEVVVVDPGAFLTVSLRPEPSPVEALTALAFVEQGQRVTALAADLVAVKKDGTITLSGSAEDLVAQINPGRATWIVAVAVDRYLPKWQELAATIASDGSLKGVKLIRVELELRAGR